MGSAALPPDKRRRRVRIRDLIPHSAPHTNRTLPAPHGLPPDEREPGTSCGFTNLFFQLVPGNSSSRILVICLQPAIKLLFLCVRYRDGLWGGGEAVPNVF